MKKFLCEILVYAFLFSLMIPLSIIIILFLTYQRIKYMFVILFDPVGAEEWRMRLLGDEGIHFDLQRTFIIPYVIGYMKGTYDQFEEIYRGSRK